MVRLRLKGDALRGDVHSLNGGPDAAGDTLPDAARVMRPSRFLLWGRTAAVLLTLFALRGATDVPFHGNDFAVLDGFSDHPLRISDARNIFDAYSFARDDPT